MSNAVTSSRIFSLEGKTAIVTGGGTGLGKVICHALSEAGANLVIAARRPEPINGVAEEIGKLGKRAIALSADVTDSHQVDRLVEKDD